MKLEKKFFELSRNRTCIKSLEDFCLIRWTISSTNILYEISVKKTIHLLTQNFYKIKKMFSIVLFSMQHIKKNCIENKTILKKKEN